MMQVFPTKGNLIAMKRSLSLALLGYDLLDRKRNILIHELMTLVDKAAQLPLFYVANGVLSAVSDNVFVASVYVTQINNAFQNCSLSREQFDMLAIAINSGTNLPSVATPKGQAAFLFLLTSAIAPLIRLSYGRMFIMAIPYTIVLSIVGFLCTWYLLPYMTDIYIDMGLLNEVEQVCTGK